MRKSKDKLVVMVVYWQSFSPPSSQKVNTSSSPSNGCPCILIVTKTCRYWPSTVLLSYHVLCSAAHSSDCCSSSLLSPPASVRTPDAFRQPAASSLNFWFQNWSRWTKHCREAHQATCDVSNCVKGQALARKRKRGGVRGREGGWTGEGGVRLYSAYSVSTYKRPLSVDTGVWAASW